MKYAAIALALLLLAGAGSVSAQEASGIRAVYRPQGVPTEPEDPTWQQAPVMVVKLMGQMMVPPHGGGSVTEIGVRAFHDGSELGLRLTWADTTENREVGVDTFRDAVAVGFPTTVGETVPSPFMGDAEHPVNIWQWTADFDANAKGTGSFAERYPHTEGVWYYPQDYSVTREVRSWRGTEPVIELEATGWGKLERKVTQNVWGIGTYQKVRWTVVLRRRLNTGSPGDTQFRPGESSMLILAAWNGGNEEVNGKKAVTMQWTPFSLDSTYTADR